MKKALSTLIRKEFDKPYLQRLSEHPELEVLQGEEEPSKGPGGESLDTLEEELGSLGVEMDPVQITYRSIIALWAAHIVSFPLGFLWVKLTRRKDPNPFTFTKEEYHG